MVAPEMAGGIDGEGTAVVRQYGAAAFVRDVHDLHIGVVQRRKAGPIGSAGKKTPAGTANEKDGQQSVGMPTMHRGVILRNDRAAQ